MYDTVFSEVAEAFAKKFAFIERSYFSYQREFPNMHVETSKLSFSEFHMVLKELIDWGMMEYHTARFRNRPNPDCSTRDDGDEFLRPIYEKHSHISRKYGLNGHFSVVGVASTLLHEGRDYDDEDFVRETVFKTHRLPFVEDN